MNSMTGYGKGSAEKEGIKITVEIKSVNHKFADCLFKLPRKFQFAEDAIRKTILAYCKRGHFDIFFNYTDNRPDKGLSSVDLPLAQSYLLAAKELEKIGFENDLGVYGVMRLPDVLKSEEEEDDEEMLLALVVEAATEAAKALCGMRALEGEKLQKDILVKLADVAAAVEKIAERAPEVASDYRKKLASRVKEALSGTVIDEGRIAAELALFIDKSNIDEELTRLKSHISHYYQIMSSSEPAGKKLDFLTQEANREVNTIGSKCSDLEITKLVLFLKNCIEMIREQIQNIE